MKYNVFKYNLNGITTVIAICNRHAVHDVTIAHDAKFVNWERKYVFKYN